MSKLEVKEITPISGETDLTLGQSGGTVTLADGATAIGFGPEAPEYPVGQARAWVNFNGTGAVSIRDSINVSSITDNGTGYYTVNFTTAMPDTNYAYVGSARRESSGFGSLIFSLGGSTDSKTTSATIVRTGSGTTALDTPEINIAFFR